MGHLALLNASTLNSAAISPAHKVSFVSTAMQGKAQEITGTREMTEVLATEQKSSSRLISGSKSVTTLALLWSAEASSAREGRLLTRSLTQWRYHQGLQAGLPACCRAVSPTQEVPDPYSYSLNWGLHCHPPTRMHPYTRL